MKESSRMSGTVLQFEPVEYTTLSEMVAAKLRDEIIESRLSLDTRVTESDLSAKLGVSRAVIREAVMMLVREGLMVKAHNRFTKVVTYTNHDIQEIYDMRVGLELTGARICIEKPNIANELAEKEHRMLMLSSVEGIDRLAFVYADMGFHTHIIEASGNNRLIEAWSTILSPCLVMLYRYTLSCGEGSPLGRLSYDHSKIIRAFASHNYETVSMELMEHINVMKLILLNDLPRL